MMLTKLNAIRSPEMTMNKYARCVVTIFTVLIATIAGAADIEIVLSTDWGIVHGGDTIIMDIYLHNNTDAALIGELPSPLTCTVSSGQDTVSLNANPLGREAMPQVQVKDGIFGR